MIRRLSFFSCNKVKILLLSYHVSYVSFTLLQYLPVFFQSPLRKRGVLVAIIRQRVMEDKCVSIWKESENIKATDKRREVW